MKHKIDYKAWMAKMFYYYNTKGMNVCLLKIFG